MILYRLTKCIYADDLSGTGASTYGGRWNSEGKPAIYFTSSRALAVLEVLVHLPPLNIPLDYCILEVEVPDKNMLIIHKENLPDDWSNVSPPAILKKTGNDFLVAESHLIMQVPSSIVPAEYNYLLNVRHPEMKSVKIIKKEAFSFDNRLL